MERSDQQLMSDVAAGDQTAFTEFYDRHAARVLGVLRKLLGPFRDAEDVLQETFWQAWRRADRYEAVRATPLVWLLLLARSQALDFLRRHGQETAVPLGHEPALIDDPCRALECDESCRQVREALDVLPEEQRSAITLAYYGGLTNEQIARYQEIPLGTAKTRIRLGMRRLRDLLTEGQRPAR
jgi:RNA polymerase sigma-70 factor (ECF subfamily)